MRCLILTIFYFVLTQITCNSNTSYLNPVYSYLRKNASISENRENFRVNLGARDDKLDTKDCLKNITNCIKNDLNYELTSNEIAKGLFSRMPPFDLSQIQGVSKACQIESRRYIKDLGKFEMWALRMYDSSGKLPSGILNGNINQLGDFDMCLNVQSPKITGKYCLASMQFEAPDTQYLAAIYRLIHSHQHFRSKLEDPGHRVPRFSSVNWALCVPSACSPKDVELGLETVVRKFFKNTHIRAKYLVDQSMCHSKAEAKPVPISTWIALSVFIFVAASSCLASLYESYSTSDHKNEWIVAFSLRKNLSSLCSTSTRSNDIMAIHGIRFINALMLLIAHKCMALFFMPWYNRTDYVEQVSQPWTVIGRAASLYTDPFLMFSATLTTYTILSRLEETKKLNLVQEYVSRLMRIVPTFIALIGFCTFILPWLNNGPMWNMVVTHHSDICKKNWWRNLLFIHNYYGFEEMCLTHTHHVGIDTQLFFISPFMIYLVWKWPKRGSAILAVLAGISTLLRYKVTYTMKLNNYIHFGTSIQELFDTADYMYTLPAHRATVYIMGIFLGYILQFYKAVVLTNTQLNVGNAVALFSFLVSFVGPSFMGKIDYVYNPTHAACYAAFSPILWCLSFAWIVWLGHLGYRGPILNLVTHPIWTLWTKISYTVYLTQFPAYFYNVGTTRTPGSYEFFCNIFNLNEFLWIVVLSCTLTVLFETPFQNIRNLIYKKTKKTKMDDLKQKIT